MLQEILEYYYKNSVRLGRKQEQLQRDLYFNKYIDDKRLVQSSFDSHTNDDAHEVVKLEVLSSCTKTWQFVSHLPWKFLPWALSYFHGGAGGAEPPSCFVSNIPLCMVCVASDLICEEMID